MPLAFLLPLPDTSILSPSLLHMQAVYGVLSAIEGLDAFRDMQEHTQIGPWYQAVKEEVAHHHGAGRTS